MSGLDGALLEAFTQGINAPEGPEDAGKLARVNEAGDNIEFVGVEIVFPPRSITGATAQEQIDSIVAALVALGLATDDRS